MSLWWKAGGGRVGEVVKWGLYFQVSRVLKGERGQRLKESPSGRPHPGHPRYINEIEEIPVCWKISNGNVKSGVSSMSGGGGWHEKWENGSAKATTNITTIKWYQCLAFRGY